MPEALDVRGAGQDDRELAVRGWFSPYPRIPCAHREVRLLLQEQCPDQYIVLQRDPDDLTKNGPGGSAGHLPTSPNVELYLDDVDLAWQPESAPVEIVVIGHFDDRRSAACPAAEEQACRDRFVVDRVDRVDGVDQPLSAMHLSEPMEPSELARLDQVRAPLGDALVLSVLIGQSSDGFPFREPAVDDGPGGIDPSDLVWVFRVLENGLEQSYAVDESTGALYRMEGTRLTVTRSVPDTSPPATTPPIAAPTPAPSAEGPSTGHVRMLALPDGLVGSVRTGIEDQDDMLTGARIATPEELTPSDAPLGRTLGLTAIGDRELLIRWTGSVCDVSLVLQVIRPPADPNAPPVQLDLFGQREPCDAIAIERGVVLTFRDPVDPRTTSSMDSQLVQTFPDEVLGLPVLDVEAAMTIQATPNDDRELAVASWFSPGPGLSCAPPSQASVSPLQPGCGSDLNWLLERAEMLTFIDGPTTKLVRPLGPGIHPHFAGPPLAWPTTTTIERPPIPIVAVGHFDDPGATRCPAKDLGWCRDLFVIDRVAWADGSEMSGIASDPDAVSTPDEIQSRLDQVAPTSPTVGIWPIAGAGIGNGELAGHDWPEVVLRSKRVWIVTRLEDERLRTYVVLDDDPLVYRVDDDGVTEITDP